MNESSSPESPARPPLDPEAISRRAYELWENEGRIEGNEMRHWLQAEEELKRAGAPASTQPSPAMDEQLPPANSAAAQSDAVQPRPAESVGGAGISASRGSKRGSSGPFVQPKNGAAGNDPNQTRRKPGPATR